MTLPSCNFCQRLKNETRTMWASTISGPFVCNWCVDQFKSEMVQEGKKKTPKEVLLKPKEIKAHLDQYVIGQESAKRTMAVAVYNHFKRKNVATSSQVELTKSNILLAGPSGSGKTHLARAIAKLLKVPFFVGDATKLTQSGYVGDDVESLLQGLIQDAQGDIERAKWGIIYVDEADKIARKSGRGATGYRDVNGEGVQQSLLKLVEGGKVSVPRGSNVKVSSATDVIDTTNILFIFAGSFQGIQEVVNHRVNHGLRLGFASHAEQRKQLTNNDLYTNITEADYLEYGLIKELLGRLPVRTTTLELTEEELLRVLTEPKDAVINQMKTLFALDNISLVFEDAALKALAMKAKDSETGVRYLRTLIEALLQNVGFEAPSDPTIREIRVTEESVIQGMEPQIFRSE